MNTHKHSQHPNTATKATHRSLAYGVMPMQGAHIGYVFLKHDTHGEVLKGHGGTGGAEYEVRPRATDKQFVAPRSEEEGKTARREFRPLSHD